MLRLALAAKPPTGFMHDIVVEDSGEQKGTFDIKHGGLLPIVDLARYAALQGRRPRHPDPRAAAAPRPTRECSRRDEARILEEAFELFSALRLEHQVEPARAGAPSRTTASTRSSSTRSPGDICGTPSGRSRPCSGR